MSHLSYTFRMSHVVRNSEVYFQCDFRSMIASSFLGSMCFFTAVLSFASKPWTVLWTPVSNFNAILQNHVSMIKKKKKSDILPETKTEIKNKTKKKIKEGKTSEQSQTFKRAITNRGKKEGS